MNPELALTLFLKGGDNFLEEEGMVSNKWSGNQHMGFAFFLEDKPSTIAFRKEEKL